VALIDTSDGSVRARASVTTPVPAAVSGTRRGNGPFERCAWRERQSQRSNAFDAEDLCGAGAAADRRALCRV